MSAIALPAEPTNATHAETSSCPSTRGNLLRMLPFLCLFYLQLVHHQPWRDELNAWGLVLASHSLRSLLTNIHYEAHPALWYLLLFAASKLTHAVWMMKLLQGCIGSAIYLASALTTPLFRAEQIFFYCSYFVLFEYTVMSRMYGLSLLFLIVYLWSSTSYPQQLIGNGILLGLIANVDATGIILSCGLVVEYFFASRRHHSLRSRLYLIATYGFFVALSVITLWPAPDISWRSTGHLFASSRDGLHLFAAVLDSLAVAFLPINSAFPHRFWNAHAYMLPALYLPVAMLVVATCVMVFRRSPLVLLMVTVTAGGGIVFGHLVYLGDVRHFGITWLAFVAGIWILRARGQNVSKLAYMVLFMGAVAGSAALFGQWTRPFADDDAAAKWLTGQHLQDASFIGTPDTHVIGVPITLRRPIYLLDCACIDTYMKFSNRRDSFDPQRQVEARLATAVHLLHAPEMIFMRNRPFNNIERQELAADVIDTELLAQFTAGDVEDEHFFLYKVSSPAVLSPSLNVHLGKAKPDDHARLRGGSVSAEGLKESRRIHAE